MHFKTWSDIVFGTEFGGCNLPALRLMRALITGSRGGSSGCSRPSTRCSPPTCWRRLARAHRLLGDPRRGPEKISAVALDCGFGDVSYFNRAFRRRYGRRRRTCEPRRGTTPAVIDADLV
jgi:hypothetical protein